MKDQKLQDLMKLANEGHEGVLDAHNRCIDAAIKCGDALNAAKELVEHGKWTTFLCKNFNGSHRTAQRYMRVALAVENRQIDLKNNYISLLEVEEDITEIPFPSDNMDHHRDDTDANNDAEPVVVVDDTVPDPPKKPSKKKDVDPLRDALKAIGRAMGSVSGKKQESWAGMLRCQINRYMPEDEDADDEQWEDEHWS